MLGWMRKRDVSRSFRVGTRGHGPSAILNLKGMIEWYLSLKDVKAKKSNKRDIQLLDSISRIPGLERKISEINPGCIELYCTERLSEDSPAKKNSKMPL